LFLDDLTSSLDAIWVFRTEEVALTKRVLPFSDGAAGFFSTCLKAMTKV